ncbi:MAG: DNA-directed RNA polymerase subunit alpha [Actinomycetota bacterium]
MLVVHRPQIAFDASEDPNFARVTIEPLEPGFGYTLGNSLRRTLISSIPGAAVTAIKIQGVQHEFSTIPGVKEDVTDIILNIKQMVLRSESQEASLVRLNISGPAEVTAGDIELPSGLEVLNPELHICTINKRARLEVEMTVEMGRGYVSSDRNKPANAVIGLIPIDSIFSPVRRVTYSVEPTRVEQKTDYDRLIVDIETNGGLNPKEALSAAGRTLVELFQLFAELAEGPGLQLGPEPGAEGDGTDLSLPIEEMDFSVRSYNCLKREGVTTIGQLVEKSEQDLLDIRNFGQKSIDEVKQKLAELNLGLKQRSLG